MTSPIADGVLAATHKLVQQAMTGQWQDVPKTVEERRALLDQLSASATPQDQHWLHALKQAMAESDAAVAKMAGAPTLALPRTTGEGTLATTLAVPRATEEGTVAAAATVDGMLDMIRGSR